MRYIAESLAKSDKEMGKGDQLLMLKLYREKSTCNIPSSLQHYTINLLSSSFSLDRNTDDDLNAPSKNFT